MLRKFNPFFVVLVFAAITGAVVITGCTGIQAPSHTAPNISTEPVYQAPVPVPSQNITRIPAQDESTFSVYSIDDVKVESVFLPTGYMGTPGAINVMRFSSNNPHTAPTSMRVQYFPLIDNDGWAGVYWQYPNNNWGEQKGYNLSGHSKLTFFARGEDGGEIATFSVGGIKGRFNDTISTPVSTGSVHLTKEWKQYVIDLRGMDLSQISGGFCVVVTKQENPRGLVIYIDDLYYQ